MQNISYNTKKIQKWSLSQKNPPIWLYNRFEELSKSDKKGVASGYNPQLSAQKALKLANKIFILYPRYEKLWIAYLDVLFWNYYQPELLETCLKACKMFPDSTDFQCRLGRAYLYNGEAERAAEILRNCPDTPSQYEPPWWCSHYLARAEYFSGNTKEAVDIYKKVVAKWPHSLLSTFRQIVTFIPEAIEVQEFADKIFQTVHDDSIYGSLLFYNFLLNFSDNNHMELSCKRLYTMIDRLSAKAIPLNQPEKDYTYMAFTLLYLATSNTRDLVLQRKLANLFIQCCDDVTSYSVDSIKVKKKSRLRIGIAISRINSQNYSHTAYNIFKYFDVNKFELILFVDKNVKDDENFKMTCSIFSKVIIFDMDNNWRGYKESLLNEKLDIYMGENVMYTAHTTAFFSRFAPLQINIIDFLSGFEAPHLDYILAFGGKNNILEWSKHESAKYAIISQNYIAPMPQRCQPAKIDYDSLYLPNAPFFFYPNSSKRIFYKDDHIIATLLRNNPEHYFFVLIDDIFGRLIWYRWEKIMPDCMDRIKFVQRTSLPIFLGLIVEASAILFPLSAAHGALTGSTVFSQGAPLVTGYGSHFGSQITKFQYSQMGVEGLVASSHEEYISIAQRLIDDPAWKAQKSREIKENFHKMYNPLKASQEMQEFLLKAYDRARLGLKPEHYEYGNFIDNE